MSCVVGRSYLIILVYNAHLSQNRLTQEQLPQPHVAANQFLNSVFKVDAASREVRGDHIHNDPDSSKGAWMHQKVPLVIVGTGCFDCSPSFFA